MSYPAPGEGSVAAYQMSAIPWVTSSQVSLGDIQEFTFPFATRFISILNQGANATDAIAVGFTHNGVASSGNYFLLKQNQQYDGELRTTKIFISGSVGATVNYQIVAGLTAIPFRNFNLLTGSDGYIGVG
jgi:hypothetical protein